MAPSLIVPNGDTNPIPPDNLCQNPVLVVPKHIVRLETNGIVNQEYHKKLRNPWWLYIILIYEIGMLFYNTVAVSRLFSKDKETLLQNTKEKSTDQIKAARVTYIIIIVIFVLTVLLLSATAILIVATLTFRKPKHRRTSLKWWVFGSFSLIILDIFAIVYIVKELIEDENEDVSVPGQVILDLVMASVDILIRAGALYFSIKFLIKLTANICCERPPLKPNKLI